MLFIGYFEGLSSQRAIAWRCHDSRALQEFLGYSITDPTPDHSSLTVIRKRLPLEIHEAVFIKVLAIAQEKKLAIESGMENPTDEELRKFDQNRPNKKVSNDEWHNPHDPDAKIVKMKDGRTHLAYKTEHAVDLKSDLILAAPVYVADESDTATLSETLTMAQANVMQAGSEAEIREVAAARGITATRV